jgi:predicted transcriptional regulator
VFKPRRSNAHYLAFIEAVTFSHQYQREKQYDKDTGEEFIETTIEDIEEANKLMKEILLRKSDDLNGATRNYFERLKDWLTQEDKNSFTNASARQALKVNASNQKRYMIALQEWGLVQKVKGDKKNGFAYEVVSYEDQKQRDKRIQTVMDDIVNTLKQSKKRK